MFARLTLESAVRAASGPGVGERGVLSFCRGAPLLPLILYWPLTGFPPLPGALHPGPSSSEPVDQRELQASGLVPERGGPCLLLAGSLPPPEAVEGFPEPRSPGSQGWLSLCDEAAAKPTWTFKFNLIFLLL